jgi:hypothetical protein
MSAHSTSKDNGFKVATLASEFRNIVTVGNVRNILSNDWAFV